MSTPVDQTTRECVSNAIDESVALSAGAGSGKTSVLATRLVNVLAAGVPPHRVAAITFTEKAAGELQRRVRDALEERIGAANDATLRGPLEHFHALTLSTVHGFCRRLLAHEPLASRWSPGTKIVEGDTRGLPRALAAWRRSLAEHDPLLLELVDLRLAPTSLREGVLALLKYRDLRPVIAREVLDWREAHAALRAVHRAVEDAAAACRNPATDKLLANNAELRAALAEWAAAPAGEATLAALVAEVRGKRTGGRAADWPKGGKEAFLAAIDQLDAWREDLFTRAHGMLVTSLSEEVLPLMREARLEHGVADFDDLLFRAAELLRIPDVRARLAERFDALLIDEVQDTDPIQAEIAALLARDPALEGDWLDQPLRAGRLFAVGDPKQSIYRFRRADVTVWNDLSALIARGGRAEELTQNFRSVPGIVDWVNHVFADMPGFSRQVAWRRPAALDPVVMIASDEEQQFDHALRHLFELKESGATVVDRDTGELRPMRWSDVMILLPRWARAPDIARLLERAGVESVVEGGATFFHGEEVRLCVSALRALDEPADTEAVVHVLRGMFGFTLEELARHVAGGGSFRYTVPGQPPGPVRDALELLRDLRRTRAGSWIPPLDDLLEQTRAAAIWSMLADGHARLANLDKLRAIVRRLESEARSPSQVVSLLVEMADRDGEDELSRADPEIDAVRITTIFKAKGLEAPIVVLLDATRTKPSPPVVAHRRERAVSVKIGARFAPPGWEETREHEIAALMEERRRWMYVACTRARDHLVLVHHAEANLLELIPAAWNPDELAHEALQTLAPGVTVRVRVGSELPQLLYRDETFPGRDAAVDALLAAPAFSGDPEAERFARDAAAALKTAARACLRTKSVGELVSKRRAPARGTGIGTVSGIVVHRAMQELDLSRPRDALEAEAPALVHALAAEHGLGEDAAAQCLAVVLRLLAHPVLDDVRRAPEHWKETPFAINERGRVVSGVIDLCFPEDESRRRWVVVDWKSDLPAEGHPLRASYEKQLAHYARALIATVVPCESVRTVLAGPHFELPEPADREQVLTEVAPALRPGLERLLVAGIPLPEVGVDVGEPVVANVELAWEQAKVALGLDLLDEEVAALAAQGWNVITADTSTVGWARRALDGVREALGVRVEDDDADDALSVDGTEAAVDEAVE